MVFKELLNFIDSFTVIIFSVEIVLKWIDNFRTFWSNPWNVFDLFVTVLVRVVSPSPPFLPPLPPSVPWSLLPIAFIIPLNSGARVWYQPYYVWPFFLGSMELFYWSRPHCRGGRRKIDFCFQIWFQNPVGSVISISYTSSHLCIAYVPLSSRNGVLGKITLYSTIRPQYHHLSPSVSHTTCHHPSCGTSKWCL